MPPNGTNIVIAIAGILQMCVAGYAISLNRLFGTQRVGWALFWAFLLLALLHLVQAMTLPHFATALQIDLEVVYTLISLLLLVGMAHLHAVLREQLLRKQAEQRLRDALESEVKRKTEHLNVAIEKLQSEIDQRNRMEVQVREQARLLDLAHDAITVHALDGTVQFWNKGAESLYGWTAQEALGRNASELFALESKTFAEALKGMEETGRCEREISNRTKAGAKVLVEEDWSLVRDAAGKPKSIMVTGADITEKRKLESQTLRLQRLESIGTLASGIAHDLNNVLTPLLMSVQLLKEKVVGEEEKELLETLKGNVLRGARLVKQILTFGRGVKGDRSVVNPGNLAREIEQLLRNTFPKALALQVDVADGLWTLTGDATQLHQVLLNLCVNARDAMPGGGRLSIRLENIMLGETEAGLDAKPGPYVLASVADTGVGIPKEIQARLFEPFFTTKEQGKGTGLGLSTCFTIVKSHGGFIRFHSEAGRGSVFNVYLPAIPCPPAVAVEPHAAAPPPRGHGQQVLVVDDEQLIRDFAQVTLECFGYRVLAAANGADAVSVYKTHQKDIAAVLMDMWMPVMDGPSAVEALKSINPAVLIIGTSGLGPVPGSTVETSLTHFLAKPYTADLLANVLNCTLSQPARRPVGRPASGAVPSTGLLPLAAAG